MQTKPRLIPICSDFTPTFADRTPTYAELASIYIYRRHKSFYCQSSTCHFTNNMFLTRVQQLQIIQAALNLELDQDENHFAQVLRARRRRRRFWVRIWLLRRPEYGQYEHLMKELEMEDTSGFKNFFADGTELVQRLSFRISN